jgi:uncharacterized spore protein YtfJ
MTRRWTFVAVTFVIALGIVGLANAQRTGGGGGGGGGLRLDPIQLLNNASVKKELDITDEQIAKLPDAVKKALSEVLSDKQMIRFNQITLQQRGIQALTDANVVMALKLSEEQQTRIKTIATDSAKELRDSFTPGAGGNFKGRAEKTATITKEAMEKAQDVLTSEQKKTWTVMVGEPFKLETPAFGGGNFGKKKKAAE